MLYTTLRQLEYVVAIANAQSLTDAAQSLNVSQPALSVALTQVEQRQGQKIFIRRKGTPISLTSFGRTFVADAEALLVDAERLENPEAQANRGLHNITLGCFEDLAPTYLAPVLLHLRRTFPQITFTAHVCGFEDLANNMQNGQIDLAITYDLGLDASFNKHLLRTISPHAFLAPDDPLSKRAEISLQDLADRPLILSEQGLSIRHMINLFRAQGLLPRIVHRAASLEVMRSLAANNEGIGISYTIPPTDISYDGKSLETVPISNIEAKEPIVLVRPAFNPQTPPIPDIIMSIQENIGVPEK
ncbi:LysR family transcriptional regulator [Kiloniella antarctica]|uniref:LysR family transcriptional regulator n=1 Tax=Kiloniella antarctica TaxID=1550907 RepID=A0ABW5BHR4_9PROT